ncbi:hypothetical protein [Metaclostridioides mangenotii]|nr:hypothetical protein [Clostridioides mangenotii]
MIKAISIMTNLAYKLGHMQIKIIKVFIIKILNVVEVFIDEKE